MPPTRSSNSFALQGTLDACCALLSSRSISFGKRQLSLQSGSTIWLLLFRVVGYLPGTGAQAMIAHDLRAGVAQASGEETAENANAGVQGANSMGIRAAVWRPKLAGKRRQCAIALGRGLAQLRWRALRRKCPELWSAARSAGHAPTPPRSPSASTSKTSDGSGVCS